MDHDDVPLDEQSSPEYWLGICRGREAVLAIANNPAISMLAVTLGDIDRPDNLRTVFRNRTLKSLSALESLLNEYPILVVPGFAESVAASASMARESSTQSILQSISGFLIGMCSWLQECEAAVYAALLREGGHCLLREENGSHIANLRIAVFVFEFARRYVSENSLEHARLLVDEANTRVQLAHLGIDPRRNLRQAIGLYGDDAELIKLGLTPADGLPVAGLYQQARQRMSPHTLDFGMAEMSEAIALQFLAEFGLHPKRNYHEAIVLLQNSRSSLLPGSREFFQSLHHEAVSYAESSLIDGNDRIEHLSKSLALFEQSRLDFQSLGDENSAVQMNEGRARLDLALAGVEVEANLGLAAQLLEGALSTQLDDLPRSTLMYNLAVVWRTLGNLETAYHWLKQSLHLVERVRRSARSDRDRIAFFQTRISRYADIVDICERLGNSSSSSDGQRRWYLESWHWVHRAKGRALADLLQLPLLRLAKADPALWEEWHEISSRLDARERQLSEIARRYAPAMEGSPFGGIHFSGVPEREIYGRERRRVASQVDQLLESSADDVPNPEEVIRDLRNLADIEQSSGRRPLIVEFYSVSEDELVVFLLPLWQESELVIERMRLPKGSLRQLFLHTSSFSTMDPMSGPPLEEMAKTLRAATGQAAVRSRAARGRPPRRGLDPDAEESVRERARLRFAWLIEEMEALVRPWAHHLEKWEPTELVISPQSHLSLLPLHAGYWNGQPLIEHFPVSYLPTPALAQEMNRRRTNLGSQVMLIGNPTGDLPGAEQEIRWVSKHMTGCGMRATTLIRERATVRRVIAGAPGASIIHVAGHSVVDARDFLRSGIELADRRLTVLDTVAALELPSAALVYLSSCDSAQSLPGRTDDLLALARAFLYAGTPSVLATLWPLDDQVAASFAELFYRYWLREERSLAAAFQLAMCALREVYPEPYHWAPFALLGAWTDVRVPQKKSWLKFWR